ncbi:relaxase/mobilization nuclease domain-containing protein [Minwuia sp.]|uniref:relaxase/mobilization nuclease domain-containing protein n=1 Tax=Minwuia sp. TaxID=2493630 RepID=UPI003A923E0E
MILKGNRRGGAKDLAVHLMKDDNDHVELHELKGFVSDTLMGALNETYGLSKATRCQMFMYSLSVNAPPNERVSTDAILDAISQSERALKLEGQPRAIVFHEKNGRRHAHVVWSLIDAKVMKAVRLRFDREKLQPVTRRLFIQHGWDMPAGLMDRSNRDPRNFTLKEYHQAKRHGRNPKAAKAAIQTAWAISDSRAAFTSALEERGLKLALGDRARFVCVDMFGEVHGLRQALGLRVKDVRARIGNERESPELFSSVTEAKADMAKLMVDCLQQFKQQTGKREREARSEFAQRRQRLVGAQKRERLALDQRQKARWREEVSTRQSRFSTGLKGLWDGLRGRHAKLRKANELEVLEALKRDQSEKDDMTFEHLEERQRLDVFKLEVAQEAERDIRQLDRDIDAYTELRDGPELPMPDI